ncbi:MAG: DNA alkylation repair protein [Anaerolineaceae bacterium]|nr:DNA alkylation repair protein [Anaerolineaceae bacterium]
MFRDEIQKMLFGLQDERYRDFQYKLIPTVPPENVIGVRTPELRKLAKQLGKDERISEFLNDLPHRYFDENQLHAFLVSDIKDFPKGMAEVNRFLPYVDNWATCDQMSPKVFKKHRPELLEQIKVWLISDHTYTVRFALGMLMQHFLDENFDPAYLEMAASIRSDAYYINMMTAWYFATALAKQYEAALPYLEKERLDKWTHNKTIQKAVESYRITDEQKAYLKELRKR